MNSYCCHSPGILQQWHRKHIMTGPARLQTRNYVYLRDRFRCPCTTRSLVGFIMTSTHLHFIMAPPIKQKTLQKEGGPGISLNPTCTQGDSLLLSVSTIVSEECPLTKECPPPTVHAQLHNFHLAITGCVFVSSHFEVPSLMIQISMALLSYLSTLFHGFICLSASEILESTPTSQTEETSLPST